MATNSAMIEAIGGREVGALPLSIATSFAIESLAGQHPDIKVDTPPILEARELWVNVRTLIRNLIGSVDKEYSKSLQPSPIGQAISIEMNVIDSTINKVSKGLCSTVFYFPAYRTMAKRYPRASLKLPSTAMQQMMQGLEFDVLKYLKALEGFIDIREYDVEITGKHPKSLILTHYPVDLLSKSSFQGLKLIESHTGAIKGPLEWNSKLTNGKELLMMPFSPFTLQVFGDSGNLFSPKSIKHKNAVKGLAEKYNWNAMTTRDRIMLGVKSLPSDEIKADLMQML